MTNKPETKFFGMTRDVTIQNDILRYDVATLKKTNATLQKALRDERAKVENLERRLEAMQAVLDRHALARET